MRSTKPPVHARDAMLACSLLGSLLPGFVPSPPSNNPSHHPSLELKLGEKVVVAAISGVGRSLRKERRERPSGELLMADRAAIHSFFMPSMGSREKQIRGRIPSRGPSSRRLRVFREQRAGPG